MNLPLAAAFALATVVLVPLNSVTAQNLQADSAFQWTAKATPDTRFFLNILNGNVRIESADIDEVRVKAVKSWRRGAMQNVDIEIRRVGPSGRDILICGVWKFATLSCGETSYAVNNDGTNDTRLDFVVTVPRKMSVRAGTVTGEVHILGVEGPISGSTVNGDLTIAVRRNTNADVSISTVNGSFESDFQLPITGRVRRGSTTAKLGRGGQRISFSTVNARMRLVRL